MSTSWFDALTDATKYEISQHGRNRVALALIVGFIPVWLLLMRLIIPATPVEYYLNVTGRTVTLDGNRLTMISGAVTLIIGFMMFSAVRRSADFDRRLVLADYARSALLPAKLLALLAAACVVSLYATIVLVLFWMPHTLVPFFLGLALSGLAYGGIGIVLGLLPTYGSMQNAVGAAFTGDLSAGYYLLGALWLGAAATLGLIAFHRRTRDHINRLDILAPRPVSDEVATVVVTSGADGTLQVRSTSGPVLVCSCLADTEGIRTFADFRPGSSEERVVRSSPRVY